MRTFYAVTWAREIDPQPTYMEEAVDDISDIVDQFMAINEPDETWIESDTHSLFVYDDTENWLVIVSNDYNLVVNEFFSRFVKG